MVSSTFKFKVKRNANGEVVRHKARLVARGLEQSFGEAEDTFAPTPRPFTIRLVLAMIAIFGLIVVQADVRCAFLQARLIEPIFLIPCLGLGFASNVLLRLQKSLYGLREAARI